MLREVRIETGLVRGIPAADPRITAFKGIPFAAPATGKNRWRAPQPAEPWEGVRECCQFGNIAMQETPGEDPEAFYSKEWHVDPEVPMGEDCLQLNVWTPAKRADEKLPVMIWFYGGGLLCGYPSEMEFDGERIARRGVILVSVNYRVNVFGFLAHPELTKENPDFPTNFGHLDQRAGIEWVIRNIEAFGGDPKNLTIFGQSAGGGSTFVQICSPLNRGLFQRAICHSSGGLLPPSNESLSLAEAEKRGEEFFKDLGVSTLEEARALDARVILKQALSTRKYAWGTVIGDRLMPEKPSYMILENNRNDVDLITGNTLSEFPVGPRNVHTEEELIAYARGLYGDDAERYLAIVKKGASSVEDMVKNGTYNRFRLGNLIWTDVNTELRAGKMYFYSFHPEIPGDNAGSFHSSDLWFAFETLAKCWRPFKGKHYDLARQMCNYWTNFAKTGDPNGPDQDGTPMPEWRPVDENSSAPMFFGDTAFMDESPRTELENFLVDYYRKRLNEKKPIGFMRP